MKRVLSWMMAAAVVGTAAGFCVGCGQRIDAPEEKEPPERLPEPDSYVPIYQKYGFDTTTDLELARGGLLYVTSAEGVVPYYQDAKTGPGWPFDGVLDPVVACEAPNGQIVVADRGDMHVKVFEDVGGSPLVSFTDPAWISFGGVAADASGNIYVADSEKSFVRAYLPDGTQRFEEDMADSGYGLGHVLNPHGLFFDGEHLWIADTGKNWVQKVVPDSIQLGLAFLDGFTYLDEDGNEVKLPFSSPVDVATDRDGYLYVADQGNRRIFKFDQDLESFAIVNYDTTMGLPPHLRAIGVNTTRVYAVDDTLGAILVWKLN